MNDWRLAPPLVGADGNPQLNAICHEHRSSRGPPGGTEIRSVVAGTATEASPIAAYGPHCHTATAKADKPRSHDRVNPTPLGHTAAPKPDQQRRWQ